jgi:histidinol-phosphate aminotransferase
MTGVDFVRRDLRGIRAYEEEAGGGLNLSANTNLFGPNPAIERARASVRPERLSEYPSLTSEPLRHALAAKLDVDAAGIVTGNGSNELIDILMRTFVTPGDRVAYHVPTFSMIPVYTRVAGGIGAPVPLDAQWSLDGEALAAADAKLTFVVRPNNPTGNAFPRAEVERVIERARGIVVVDEAYVEFLGGESFVKEIRQGNDRVIALRTFSKAHGLAGLRIGYAITTPAIAAEVLKVRGPFRLNVLSEATAVAALADDRYLQETVAAVRAERPNLARMLERHGFTVYRSDANFLFTRPPVPANALAARLVEHGIYTRDFGGDLAPFLRVTVGPPQATAKLDLALKDVLPKLREVDA